MKHQPPKKKRSAFRKHIRKADSKPLAKTKQSENKRSATTKKSDIKPTAKAKHAINKPAAKRKQVAPHTPAQYFAKPEKFKNTWDRVLSVISKMRSEKVSLRQASKDSGISPNTVVRWGGPALQKRKNGKYVAKTQDNLLRMVMIPTSEGIRELAVRGSYQASLLGEY